MGSQQRRTLANRMIRSLSRIVRIGKEQFVAIGVFDNHRVITPPAIPDRRSPPLEFGPQRLQQSQVDRDKDAAAPNLFGLLAVEDDFAVLAVDLTDEDLPFPLVAEPLGEAELFGVERDRPLYTFHEEDRTRIPDVHFNEAVAAAADPDPSSPQDPSPGLVLSRLYTFPAFPSTPRPSSSPQTPTCKAFPSGTTQ